MGAMTEAEANAIYDVLVRECGAPDGTAFSGAGRTAFVQAFTNERPPTEWQFQGALGFNGRFFPGLCGEPHRVGYYLDEDTPERRSMVERANAAFGKLVTR